MNLKILIFGLVFILAIHTMLKKVIDIKKQNDIFKKKYRKSSNKKNKKSEETETVGEKNTEDTMKQDLLNFVESSSFYEQNNSYRNDDEISQNYLQKQPGFLNISKDNTTKAYDVENNVTLESNNTDDKYNSKLYHNNLTRIQWNYDDDKSMNGTPIEGELYAYDNDTCSFASV